MHGICLAPVLAATLLGLQPLGLVRRMGGPEAAAAHTPPPLPVVFNEGLDDSQRSSVAFALGTSGY